MLDEPLIMVFDQLEGLGLKQNQHILENFGLAIKEILTHVHNSLVILNLFPDRWQQFKDYFDSSVVDRLSQNCITLSPPKPQQIREIFKSKNPSRWFVNYGLLHGSRINRYFISIICQKYY